MWLEALVAKNILGQQRRVGDRFEAPINAGMALMGGGMCRKVTGPSPKPAPAKKAAPPKPSEPKLSVGDQELAILVGRAIADGRMPALVDALTAVGLDPDAYSNNDKREAALHAWLED